MHSKLPVPSSVIPTLSCGAPVPLRAIPTLLRVIQTEVGTHSMPAPHRHEQPPAFGDEAT